MMPVTVQIRRGIARFTSRDAGRLTRHALSFGQHYDPDRLRLGPMVCHDDHVLGGGRGFDTHRHEDLEVVTWVVEGALDHVDSLGTDRRLTAGSMAVLSAGSGVQHAETAAPGVPTRFVQAWLVPDEPGRQPAYAATTPAPLDLDGRAALLAAGPGVRGGEDAPLRLGATGAALQVVRLEAGQELALGPDTSPPGSLRHVFVATGALLRFSLAEPLSAGDTLVVDGPEAQAAATVVTAVATELMVWTFA